MGFPHTQTTDPRDEDLVNLCPFTEQVWYFAKMMADRRDADGKPSHEVIHIGMPGSRPPEGVEHVDAMTEDWWRILYGWKKPEAPFILCREHAYSQQWDLYEANVRKILLERGGAPYSSIVSCLWGHQGCTKDVPQIVVECGIGSPYAYAPFRVYLSHAWRHFHEGFDKNFGGDKWWHQVIPLPLNFDLFGPALPTAEKLNYFLVQTRMLEPKGVRWAIQVARELKTPIFLTGRGDASSFVAEWPAGARYIGMTSAKVRRELMQKAKGLFSLSRYVEPLGAVALEAAASGCPVISTDFGGYTDTVAHGYTGWRVSTFEESVWAARNLLGQTDGVPPIDPFVCRQWVEKNNSFERVGAAYEDYFTSLLHLNSGKGFLDAEPALTRKMLGRAFRDYSMFSATKAGAVTIRQDFPPGETPENGIYYHLRG